MPDENRVFDVTKPKDVAPSATSKPVIVGHQPMASDPMVKETDKPAEDATHIKVIDDSQKDEAPSASEPEAHTALNNSPAPPDAAAIFSEPSADSNEPAEKPADTEAQPGPKTSEMAIDPVGEAEPAVFPEAPSTERPAEPPADSETEPMAIESAPAEQPRIEELHFSEKNIKRSWWKPVLLVIILLLIAAYLAIDSGLINANINLPFHIFKQKQPATSSSSTPPPSTNQQAATAPSIPAGFKEYQLSGTNITFAAPTAWGAPTSSPEAGYSKRGAGQQSDGTHAYLISFASNKDVQLAVTSGKYLPAARGTQYYDYLQWCTGTSDGKYYQSTLHFTTTAGIDAPSTTVCDQGPMANVTKLDDKTIVQNPATDAFGKSIGDIYTQNLTDPNLVVFRIKDATMKNMAEIKQLLGTIKLTAAQ